MALQCVEERLARLEQAEQAATRRARRWQLTAIGMLPLALLVGLPHPGSANQAGGLPGLEQRIAVLETTTTNQASQITALQQALANETAARQSADNALQSNLAAQQTALDTETAARQAGDSALQSQVTAHEDVLSAFSRVGNDLILTGVNLHLRNGMGATAGTNGLGNLIVGYNENSFDASRTGSHNVVVGSENGWEAYGGLVVGSQNRITARFASVTGGSQNTASGDYASITGGELNIADGVRSVVSAGFGNTASGLDAAVSGGAANLAVGNYSAVGGGKGVAQTSEFGWGAGGSFSPGSGGMGVFHAP